MPETPSLFKGTKIEARDLVKRYQDLLEIARLVSWCMDRDMGQKRSWARQIDLVLGPKTVVERLKEKGEDLC